MILRTIREVEFFLSATPGPSPWYLISNGPTFQSKKTEWVDAVEYSKKENFSINKNSLTGKTFFVVDDDIKMICDFQCYVQKIDENKFIVWYEQTEESVKSFELKIIISMFDINRLHSFPSINIAVEKVNSCNKIYFEGKPLGQIEINKNLKEGFHQINVPYAMLDLDELLILANAITNGLTSNYYDKMTLALFIVNFKNKTLEIVSQDWFNKGSFDFMYQWPTRLKRDELTKSIYGDGIRINPFMLDESKRNVETWFGN